MEKNVVIKLNKEFDLCEKYNSKCVSRELLDYIINQCELVKEKDNIKIKIYDSVGFQSDIKELIKIGVEKEYKYIKQVVHVINLKQVSFIIIGTLFLLLSMVINESSVFKEIILIAGCVSLWKAIEIQLIYENRQKKRLKILKKLLSCEYCVYK